MIRFVVFLSTISVVVTAGAQPAMYTPAPSFSGPHPAVVRVAVPERDGAAYGSGALVAVNESSGLVLTNWHVVRDSAGAIVVYFPDGFRSGAYLLRVDRDWDLAALAIRRPNVQPIAIATQAPQPGEELTIAGYGSGSYRSVTGRVTQYVSPGGNQPFEMIELSAPARNGDSGGPIFNSRGELAGTLFGSAFGRTTGSYCGRLRWFLNSADGDFRRISAQALLAQQAQRNQAVAASPLPQTTTMTGWSDQTAKQGTAGSPLPQATESTGTSVAVNTPRSPTPQANVRAVPTESSETSSKTAAPMPAYAYAATSASNSGPMAPVVGAASTAASGTASGTAPGANSELPASVPIASLPAPPTGPLPDTNQMKTFLAAVGILAVLYHAMRLLGWALG